MYVYINTIQNKVDFVVTFLFKSYASGPVDVDVL